MRKKKLGQTPGLDAATYIVLIIAAVVALFPVLWGLFTALKTDGEVNSFPPTLLPSVFTGETFATVLFQSSFPRYLFNSILVTVICILVAIIVASHAAYAVTNFRIRFRNQIMFLILMTSMIPPVVMLVPLYMLSVKIGLYDTHFLLILIYTAWRIPVLTWILRGFFEKLPKEIIEAGTLDGCSKPMIFSMVGAKSASRPPSRSFTFPRPTTISGTGLVVWAVKGEPSASYIWSALPWSAVTSATPPLAKMASTVRPTQVSTASTAALAASNTPVWPTMSQLA